MDQDNRQGSGFNQNNNGAPMQQSFFFNQQQQQQLLQNQLLQKQVPGGQQISQTPQMLPAQRNVYQMQGSQPLFQQAQLSGQGIGQLSGVSHLGYGGPGGHDIRHDLQDGQSVVHSDANQTPAHQMNQLFGMQPGGYSGAQDQLLQSQQRQQSQQQMNQQPRMNMGGVLGDSQSFIGMGAGVGQMTQGSSNQGQSQMTSQYQQLLGMQNPSQSIHQSIPQTPSQKPFILPHNLLQSQDLGSLQQASQMARQQQPGQSQQAQTPNGAQGGGNAGHGLGGHSSQNQINTGNGLLGSGQLGQTGLSAALQQPLAQSQPNAQGSNITSHLLNQLLSQNQGAGANPNLLNQMKAGGQWTQSMANLQSMNMGNQTSNQNNQLNQNQQNRQNEQSSSFHQASQPKPSQMQQHLQASSQKTAGLDGQGQTGDRSNFHQMWQMQQQNNRHQQQDERQSQQQFQQPGQQQNPSGTPSQQAQPSQFQNSGGNPGQNQQLNQNFQGGNYQTQGQSQNQPQRQQDAGNNLMQNFQENNNNNIKQEAKQQVPESPFPVHKQMAGNPQQQQQPFPGQNLEHSYHSQNQGSNFQKLQNQGQSAQQPAQSQFYQGSQPQKQGGGNDPKQNESQQHQQQFNQNGFQNQHEMGNQGGKPQYPTPQGMSSQMNIPGFNNAGGAGGPAGLNRMGVQGSHHEQSYQGGNGDQEGNKGLQQNHQALFQHFNQSQSKDQQINTNQQQLQPPQNPLGNLQYLAQQKQSTGASFSPFQQMQGQNSSAVQQSLQSAPNLGMQQKNSGMRPNQPQAMGNQNQHQNLLNQMQSQHQTPSIQPVDQNQQHNQNFFMNLGVQQQPGGNQQVQLDLTKGQQPGAPFGMNVKNESVNQQHLLAAISNMNQGQDNAGNNNMQKSMQPNGLYMPGSQGQQISSGGGDAMQSKIDSLNMNNILGSGIQGGDQQRLDMMSQQFGPDGAPNAPGNQNGMDPNMLQLQQSQQQQQPGYEWNISSIPSLSKMAEFCATRGDYQQAIEYYRQLITHDPNNGASWTALGHCYLLTEDIHKAFTAYQHALYSVEDMNDPQLWYGIGILYERFESYDNAISALIGVLKMSPNFYQKSEVLYKLGTIFAKTNQIDQASKFFQNSILTSSFSVKKKVDTLIKIGLLNEEKKDFQQAKRSFEAALSLNDKNVRVYQHLAWCSFRHGNIESALRYITKAEKRSKDNVYSLYIKGRCLICLDNTQEAFECLSQAAQQLPSEAVFWTSLAVLMYNMGKVNVSFEVITQATTLKHELWEVWYNLGILYETCKQPEEALIAYDMVLSIDPKQPDAQKRIFAIKQPKYQEEMNDSKNPVQLQMKHPSYCIPNTLTILRNYWKHHQNKQQTTLQPVQPPQDGLSMHGADSVAGNMNGPSGIDTNVNQLGDMGQNQNAHQPQQIQLSQNALQSIQPQTSMEGNQINLGNLSKLGEQPSNIADRFDQFNNINNNNDGDNGQQNNNNGQPNNNLHNQFNNNGHQQKQDDIQQQLNMQADHTQQLMQQLQQQTASASAQAQAVANIDTNGGKNGEQQEQLAFKFGANQNNKEDGGMPLNPMGPAGSQGNNMPQAMMSQPYPSMQQNTNPQQQQKPTNPASGAADQQQQMPSNPDAAGQNDPANMEKLFSQFQHNYQQQMGSNGAPGQQQSNNNKPDGQQPQTSSGQQPQQLQQDGGPSQQMMQGHFHGMNANQQQQQQPQVSGDQQQNVDTQQQQQQQQQFEQFMQQNKDQQQLVVEQQQNNMHQQFNNGNNGGFANGGAGAAKNATAPQFNQQPMGVDLDKKNAQQFGPGQDQKQAQGNGLQQNQQQPLGNWQNQQQPQIKDLQAVGAMPAASIGQQQAARPPQASDANANNNPAGNGPKDDETEQEQSSDENDNNAVAQGPPQQQQVAHGNFNAMHNNHPLTGVNPSSTQQQQQQNPGAPSQQQAPLDLNVEGGNSQNDQQFRKPATLGFQNNTSGGQAPYGLQPPMNQDANCNNILGFTNSQNPGLPSQGGALGLQQPGDASAQQNPMMGGATNIQTGTGDDNQNDLLGFGLGELAGKFKTSKTSEHEPPQIEGLSANDQNVGEPNHQQQQQQQQQQLPAHGLNPEQSSEGYAQKFVQNLKDKWATQQQQPTNQQAFQQQQSATNNNGSGQQQQVDLSSQQHQLQLKNGGAPAPQGNNADLMYSQQQQQPGQAPSQTQGQAQNPSAQQPQLSHEGGQGGMLGLLPPKQQQPPSQYQGGQQQEPGTGAYHNQQQLLGQQQPNANGNPDLKPSAVFQNQPGGAQGANLGSYQQLVQSQGEGATGAPGHYGAAAANQQQQFQILRKMPFIAQTQLGFAPMKMGGNDQGLDQQQQQSFQQMHQQDQQQQPPSNDNNNGGNGANNGQGQQ